MPIDKIINEAIKKTEETIKKTFITENIELMKTSEGHILRMHFIQAK